MYRNISAGQRNTLNCPYTSNRVLTFVIALAVVAVCTILLSSNSDQSIATGDTSGSCGENLTWSYDINTGELTISGTGDMVDMSPVRERWGGNDIRSISFPDGLTYIGAFAFEDCNSLSSVEIPDSVLRIGNSAFSGCHSLREVSLSDSLQTIGIYAFENCTSLTTIIVPESVTKIDSWAFNLCESLFEVINKSSLNITAGGYDNGVISMNALNVFATESESTISIIDGKFVCGESGGVQYLVRYIGNETAVTLPEKINGENYRIYQYAFRDSTTVVSIQFNESVESIGKYAFEDCSSLSSVTIPSSVSSIGVSPFKGCSELTAIVVDDANLRYSSLDGVLFNKNQSHIVAYPAGKADMAYIVPGTVTTMGEAAFSGCSHIVYLELSDSLIQITPHLFENCSMLTAIIIPDSVKDLFGHAFDGCVSLKSITIPGSIKDIREDAFNDCTSLADIKFSEGLKKIHSSAFAGCTSLKTVQFPNTLTEIGLAAFRGCTSLSLVSIPDSVTTIEDIAFSGCTSLSAIVIPNTVTTLRQGTFSGCTGLTTVSLSNSLSELGSDMFMGCTSLESIELPSSITSIGFQAFMNCSALKSINLPDNVTTMGTGTFAGCISLTSIHLPNSLTVIDGSTFSRCSLLTSIIIPNSVTRISSSAFDFCTSLSQVVVPSSVTTIETNAFRGCACLFEIINKSDLSITKGSTSNGEIGYHAKNIFTSSEDSTIEIVDGKFVFGESEGTKYLVRYIGSGDSVTLPDSYKGTDYMLGAYSFEYCAPKSVVVPDSVIGMGLGVFQRSPALEQISLPDSLTCIETWTFMECSSLSSITIPSSVTRIKDAAFRSCTSLVSVTYPCTLDLQKGSTDSGYVAYYAEELNMYHTLSHIDRLEPTCVNDGHSAYVRCELCDYVSGFESIPAIGHDYSGSFDWAQDGRTCTITLVCGNDAAHNIAVADIPAMPSVKIPATCTVMGTTTYTVSFTYGGVTYTDTKDVQDIPATGHSYVSMVTAPTCTAEGYTTHTCSVCQDTYDDNHVDPLGHDYGAVFTWNTDGSACTVTLTCTNDNSHVEVFSNVAATPSVKIPATCTVMGTTSYSVSVVHDGVTYSDTKDIQDISALGHDYAAEYLWSGDGKTCTVTLTCANDAAHTVVFSNVTAHSSVKVPATCTVKGTSTYTVSVTYESIVYTDSTDIQDIPPTGHSYVSVITEPTCTSGGFTTHICSECQDTYTDAVTDPLGHDYSVAFAWADNGSACTVTLTCRNDASHVEVFSDVEAQHSVKVPATCTVKGTTAYTVSVTHDGVTYTDSKDIQDIPANGHSYVDTVTAPTCTAGGFTTHTCSICQHSYIDAHTDPLGHDYSAAYVWSADGNSCTITLTCGNDGTHTVSFADVAAQPSVKIPATCTAKGTTTYTVSVTYEGIVYSDSKDVQDIPATGHSYVDTVTLPTSTEQGYTTHVCSVCQNSFVDSYVDPLGDHQYATYDWSADMMTCTVTIVCANDPGHSHSVMGDVTSAVKTEPTATMMGITTYSVSVTYDGLVYSASRDIRDIAALEPEYTFEQSGDEKTYSNTVAENQTTQVTEIFNTAKTNSGSVEVAVNSSVTDSPVTISFDSDAVNSIGGNEVSLTASVTENTTAVAGAEMVIEVSLQGATFSDGKAKVTVPLTGPVPAGKTVKVYFINGNERTDMNATVSDGKVVFETNHFSTYAVVFEDEPSAEFPIMFVVIGAVVIIAAAGAAFVIVRRRA